jgi:5S rRNA maturation endonuclease (ribonuclease M5)
MEEEYKGISKYTKRPRTEKIKFYGIKGIPHFSNSHSKNYNWKISILAKNIGGVANRGRSGKFVDYIRRKAESLINVGDIDAKQRFNELDDKLLSRRKNSVIQRRLIIPVPAEFLKDKDKLMEKFGQQLQDKYFGACYTWTASLHSGGKDFKNPHIHVLFSNCDNYLRNIREFHDKDFISSIKHNTAQFFTKELGLNCEVGLPKIKKELGITAGKHYPQWVIGTYKKYENNPEKFKEYCEKYSILQDYMDYLKNKEQIKNIVELEKKEKGIKQKFTKFAEKTKSIFDKIHGSEEQEIKNKINEIKNKYKGGIDMNLEPLRNINIGELASRLGFEQDKIDKKAYRRGDLKISIDPGTGRFNSFTSPDVKGKGAIDFVIATENKSFKESIEFLKNEYPALLLSKPVFDKKEPAKEPAPKILIMPERAKDEATAKRGIDYIVGKRKLTDIKGLFDNKQIYIDNHGNAVFVCRSADGEITGAEIKNEDFKGMAAGTNKSGGAFYLTRGEERSRLILTESAIDAISWQKLKPSQNNIIIASTAGVCTKPNVFIDDVLKKHNIKNVIIGYDSDAAGQKAAAELSAALRAKGINVEIDKPRLKDWNESIQALAKSHEELAAAKIEPDEFSKSLKNRKNKGFER